MMDRNYLSLFLILFLITLTMTSSKRASRRNRNRDPISDSQAADGEEEDSKQGVCELELSCRGGRNLPVNLPIKGPRGPSGKPGSPGLPGKQGPPGPRGESDAGMNARVAFFAGLEKNRGPVSKNTDLDFDKVITNVGGAFNGETGKFTAPFNGTYSFFVTIAAQGRQRAAVELVKNGRMVSTIWAESIPFWASASTTAILSLEAGQQVWLVLLSRACFLHGYMYSTFSGHSLFQGL